MSHSSPKCTDYRSCNALPLPYLNLLSPESADPSTNILTTLLNAKCKQFDNTNHVSAS
ncbi:hypothetical protein Hanom_Chr03g00260291 [Helianthus anomalus]